MFDQVATNAASTTSATGTVVTALGPAFAAGFAVQQLLEILDPIVTAVIGVLKWSPTIKKALMGVLSLVTGLVIAYAADLHVLQSLQSSGHVHGDRIVTGIIISAGTEGFNSIMKFLGYAKEAKKADAAGKLNAAGKPAVADVNRQPST
jgi:hypothetical protein